MMEQSKEERDSAMALQLRQALEKDIQFYVMNDKQVHQDELQKAHSFRKIRSSSSSHPPPPPPSLSLSSSLAPRCSSNSPVEGSPPRSTLPSSSPSRMDTRSPFATIRQSCPPLDRPSPSSVACILPQNDNYTPQKEKEEEEEEEPCPFSEFVSLEDVSWTVDPYSYSDGFSLESVSHGLADSVRRRVWPRLLKCKLDSFEEKEPQTEQKRYLYYDGIEFGCSVPTFGCRDSSWLMLVHDFPLNAKGRKTVKRILTVLKQKHSELLQHVPQLIFIATAFVMYFPEEDVFQLLQSMIHSTLQHTQRRQSPK